MHQINKPCSKSHCASRVYKDIFDTFVLFAAIKRNRVFSYYAKRDEALTAVVSKHFKHWSTSGHCSEDDLALRKNSLLYKLPVMLIYVHQRQVILLTIA